MIHAQIFFIYKYRIGRLFPFDLHLLVDSLATFDRKFTPPCSWTIMNVEITEFNQFLIYLTVYFETERYCNITRWDYDYVRMVCLSSAILTGKVVILEEEKQ